MAFQKGKKLNELKSKDETTQKEIKDSEEKWYACEPKQREENPIRVTGDGLLRIVRLIRTGLVDEGIQKWENSDWLNFYFWEPRLTQIGRNLAEAYLQGNAKVFKEILTGNY